MSESNRVSIKMVPELVYGTTPVDSANWQYQRFTSESFATTVNTTESNEIRTDRMLSDMPTSSKTAQGGLDIELSPTTYDDLLAAAMAAEWTTDVLKVGTATPSYSVEKHYEDIDKFIAFTGMRVGQANLSISYGEIITGSFQFMGNGSSTPATSLVGLGSVAPATTTDVMNATSDVGTVTLGGISTGMIISSMTLDINNNLRENAGIGREYATDIKYGSASITGTVELYLSADVFNLYKDVVLENDSVALSYTVSDGTNSYTFLLPKVKLSGDTPASGGKDDDIMLSLTYSALRDDVEGTSLKITRA